MMSCSGTTQFTPETCPSGEEIPDIKYMKKVNVWGQEFYTEGTTSSVLDLN